MEEFVPELILGGVSAIVGVVLIVESLKRLNVVGSKSRVSAEQAALLTGLSFGALATGAALPVDNLTVAAVIDIVAPNVFGGIAAGLAYDLVGDAFFARLQSVADAVLSRNGE